MRVSTDVLAVLDRATCEGNALSLAAVGQLDRKLYEATNKALEAAGGKWNRKAKAHLFDGDAATAIEPIILTGKIVSVRQELQQFYTPPDIAERVIALARLKPGIRVLEPSAGRGALAAPAFLARCRVDCIELDERNADILASIAFEQVMLGDFLEVSPAPVYDRVVMNPPFARNQDVTHVSHAIAFLKPGGRLVAIMSGGILFRSGKAALFRDALELMGGSIELLPEGAFKASGTNISACLVVIDVPESA